MTDVTYALHGADVAAGLMDELCKVYADAYGQVAGEDTTVKADAFRDCATGALSARFRKIIYLMHVVSTTPTTVGHHRMRGEAVGEATVVIE
ncbi:hypothetical protein AB0D32_20060 [Micromonospora sp. NPDC048170]|uniref:hypothetical protein n=1 Tax=Micromonospora sp. NPDC048170 TaxID=3154819 RepID=UPI0033C2EBC0